MSLLQMSFSGAILILAIVVIRALALTDCRKDLFGAMGGCAIALVDPSIFTVHV